jgi:hypothetical protein
MTPKTSGILEDGVFVGVTGGVTDGVGGINSLLKTVLI